MNIWERTRHLAHERLRASIMGTPVNHQERTLVIIDMQDCFLDDIDEQILPTVCSLVRHARQNEWAIIVVELDGFGNTDVAILDELAGYLHKDIVMKYRCNGGLEVIRCINDHPTWSLDLLVCGLYGDECVSETVAGLFDESDLVEVTVVNDAIWPEYMSSYGEDESGQQKESVTTTDELGITVEVES